MVLLPANSPSFGWRSIIASKQLLQAGLRKNIKSGFSTKVWSDNWIPTVSARPAKDNGVHRDPYLYVNHLIDFGSKQWKLEMISELIDPHDLPLIRGLKPSRTFAIDDYIWIHTKSGQYSVKSGYLLASQKQGLSTEVTEPSTTSLKRQVWKVKCPRKLKHFIWQAISGCIATSSRLTDRHCGTERTCTRCGANEETINHMLFECPPARQVWALSSIPSSPGTFPRPSIFVNIDFLFWRAKESGASDEQLKCFPWILWYIWKVRNEKVFNNNDINPQDTLALAEAETKSWNMAQIIEEHIEEEEATENLEQSPQEMRGTLVCQIDASWGEEAPYSGVAFTLSSQSEHLIGLKGTHRLLNPLHAELDALIWAMDCLHQKGFNSIHFETDCVQLLKVIEESEDWPIFAAEL